MPFNSNAELPDPVKAALPNEAQSVWRNVFNSVFDRTEGTDADREEAAIPQAWGAVRNAGWIPNPDNPEGKWIRKRRLNVGRSTELVRFQSRLTRRRKRLDALTADTEKKDTDLAKWGKQFGIIEKDEESQVVTAWASVVEKNGQLVEDHEGDVIFPEDLELAAWEFVSNVRRAGLMHERSDGIGGLVGSMVFTKELQKTLGIDLGQVGWLVQFHVEDPDVWSRIKSGDLPMMSVHGTGERTPI